MCRPYWDANAGRHPIAKLWQRDHTLWKPNPREIANRLGWLDLPVSMRGSVTELQDFAEEARSRRFRDVVLLGMGGSSLCAEVLRRTFGRRKGFARFHVLDSTVPARVSRVARRIDPAKTLFLVCSKSGSTIEVLSFYKYFRDQVEKATGNHAGENFVAITDGDSGLKRLAADTGFWRTFVNPSNVGGRYSALSYFGLVPAALMGLNVGELLARAREAARACGVAAPIEENPGAWLGMVMGCLARTGRDKLTLITSPSVASFSLWAEQLLAESTGKEGMGILPVVQEPFVSPKVYGNDRIFVYLRLSTDDDNEAADRHAKALHRAKFPVVVAEMKDVYDIGAAFFRWEFAVAIAGACLEINPFDQPNVQESKENTTRVLSEHAEKHALPELRDEGAFDDLLAQAKPGDYVAFMAFLEETPDVTDAFGSLRHRLLAKLGLPSTLGYGPRFLHSTGQLHKGGADNGLFVQITCDPADDIPVPGEPYSFGVLAAAQAIGDFEALREHKRRVVRIHIGAAESATDRLRSLTEMV